MQDFQYRLLHKKLPSNQELHRWKIKNSAKLKFCDEDDSISRLLFECTKIKTIWNIWEEFIYDKYTITVKVDKSIIATNYFTEKCKSILIYR